MNAHPMAGWRMLLGEAGRNLNPVRPMTVVQAVFLTLIGLTVVGVDYQSVRAVMADQAVYAQSGGYVYVIGGSINPRSCRELGSHAIVKFAGAVAYRPPIVIRSQPNRPVPLIEVSGEAASIWAGRKLPGHGWTVGSVLAEDISAPSLRRLSVVPGITVPIDHVMTPDRHPQTARALIAPRAWAGRFDECWIEFEPIESGLAASIVSVVDSGSQAELRVLASRSAGALRPEDAFAGRLTQWAWLAGAVLTSILLLAQELARRGEVALYLVLGWQRSEVVLQRLLEVVAVQLPSRSLVATAGIGAAMLLLAPSGFEVSAALNNLALLTLAEVIGAIIVINLTVPRELISTLRGA